MWLWLSPTAAKRSSSMMIFKLRRSALHAGCGDALDQKALEEEEEEEHRHERERRHGEEPAPVGGAAGVDEGPQAELDRVAVHVVEVDQRPEEIVPGPDEGEDGGRRQNGKR